MSYKRFVVAGAVMVGGLALAWPFRHARPVTQALSVRHESPDLTWSPPQDLTLQVNSQPGQSPVPELPPVCRLRLDDWPARPHFKPCRPTNRHWKHPAPPYLPMSYESLLVPVGSETNTTKNNSVPNSNLPVHEPLLPWPMKSPPPKDPGQARSALAKTSHRGRRHAGHFGATLSRRCQPLG